MNEGPVCVGLWCIHSQCRGIKLHVFGLYSIGILSLILMFIIIYKLEHIEKPEQFYLQYSRRSRRRFQVHVVRFRSKLSSSQLLLLTTAGGGGACCWQRSGGVGTPSSPCGTRPSTQSCHLASLVRTLRACRVRLHPWGHTDPWTWARYRHTTWHVTW